MSFQKLSCMFATSVLAISIAGLAGCSTYGKKSQEMRANWRSGNFNAAEKIAKSEEASSDFDDKLIWQLDFATILRATGKVDESQKIFDSAAETVEAWDAKPDIMISDETVASLTNLSTLPYRGKASDRIMLQTYRALNFLEQNKPDKARVALNAAFKAQADALERNAEQIQAAKKNAQKNKVKLNDLAKNKGISDALAEDKKNSSDIAIYADYVNPFTTWLHGIYFMHAGDGGSDIERSRKSLERVAKMMPGNKYVKADLERISNVPAEKTPLTYVVFEYGSAPTLQVSRIDLLLPIPIGNGRISTAPVSIALPKLLREEKYKLPAMTANTMPAQTLCDMNSIVKTDFENSYPIILARTLTTAFVKTAASVAANVATQEFARRDDSGAASLVALFTLVGTSVYTYASSDADIRAWQTLPGNYSLIRMRTPESRKITISVAGRSRVVDLLSGTVNIIFVKTVAPNSEPTVSQFILKK